jgi:hypothetical protein
MMAVELASRSLRGKKLASGFSVSALGENDRANDSRSSAML